MSNSLPKSVTPLVLEPGPSRRVRVITLAGFLLALLSAAALPLPLPLLLPGLLFLVAAFAYAWRHHHALSGQLYGLAHTLSGERPNFADM